MKSRTEYTILNIATGLGGYVINTILGFVCRMVFIRCLSADYLGINGLFTNILSMLSLAELGIGTAIVYALYKPLAENNQEEVASLVSFYGKAYRIIGILVGVVGLLFLPFLNNIITSKPNIHENIYVLYLFYLFNTSSTYFFSYRGTLLTAAQRNYIVTGVNYIITILQSILQVIYLLITKNYMGYLIIQTIGTFIYNILISYIAKRKFPYIDSKTAKPIDKNKMWELIKNVKALIIIKISGLLVNSTDNIIITYFNGLSVTGIASNYTLFSTTLNSLLNQIFNGITASIGNYNAIENEEDKKNMFFFVNLISFWLYAWTSIGIFLVSSDLVSLFFGSNYVLPIEIPLIIGINFYIMGLQGSIWTYKNTFGLFKYGQYLLVLTAIFNLFFSIVLGNMYGLFGILLATAISRLLTNVWYEPYAIFKYGLKINPSLYFKRYFYYTVMLIISGGLSYILCNLIAFSSLINVVLKIIICSVIPNLIFWLAFRHTKEWEKLKEMSKRTINLIIKRN